MSGYQTQLPELVWVLSRGQALQRRARGAYFMELASLLAGEQWSDHPACTLSLLGVSPAMPTTTPLMPAAPGGRGRSRR
jgi:hypothetical protein